MFALIQLFVALVFNRFKSPRRLEIENLYLRHQLNIALRQTRHRFRLTGIAEGLFDDEIRPTRYRAVPALRIASGTSASSQTLIVQRRQPNSRATAKRLCEDPGQSLTGVFSV